VLNICQHLIASAAELAARVLGGAPQVQTATTQSGPDTPDPKCH
jgi:hypothetical protein